MTTTPGNTSHIYRSPGVYTVTLTVTDAAGSVARSSIAILITGDIDTDSDGVIDIRDQCPLVYAQTPTGCPNISTYSR